jgi:hypothetical protein
MLPAPQVAALRRYYRELVASGLAEYRPDALHDGRVGGYGEGVAAYLHAQLVPIVERVTGRELRASNLYWGTYSRGAVLNRHVDRAQAQFSCNILVDFLPEIDSVSPWPLLLEVDGPGARPAAVHQRLGDAVFYSGTDVVHYRDPFTVGDLSTSIFFQFVPRDFKGTLI